MQTVARRTAPFLGAAIVVTSGALVSAVLLTDGSNFKTLFWSMIVAMTFTLFSLRQDYGQEGARWRFYGVLTLAMGLLLPIAEWLLLGGLSRYGNVSLGVALLAGIVLALRALFAQDAKAEFSRILVMIGTLGGICSGLAIAHLGLG